MEKDRLEILIDKYDRNQISEQEFEELISALNRPDSKIDLDRILTEYWDTEKKDDQNTNPVKTIDLKSRSRFLNLKLITGIAASFLLLIGGYYYFWMDPDIKLGQREIVYRTGYGEKLDILLADGSAVTLNANSHLRWNDDWEKQGKRHVELEGEAFFEVKNRDEIPFTVYTNDVTVEVLGTSFNVDSREKNTRVYLDEGKINLKLKELDSGLSEQDSDEAKEKTGLLLQPGDQIKYNSKEKKIEKEEGLTMIAAASWKLDVLNFKNMQFHEVLELLRDIYGQSFECSNGDLLTTPMYLGVPYSNWDAVRKALELSLNIEFEKLSNRRYKVKTK